MTRPNKEKTCYTCRYSSAIIMQFNNSFGICSLRDGEEMLARDGCSQHDWKEVLGKGEKKK